MGHIDLHTQEESSVSVSDQTMMTSEWVVAKVLSQLCPTSPPLRRCVWEALGNISIVHVDFFTGKLALNKQLSFAGVLCEISLCLEAVLRASY